jgi:hypothetical protein
MSEIDDDAKKALSNLGVSVAKEAYVDLLRPAAAEMGKNLFNVARLVSHALTPIEGMVWGLDKVRDWVKVALLKRLSKVAAEKIQAPPANIAGQILLQLPFCAEQERLREMYANLLAAAMNEDSVGDVHPAFVHVIQQITSEEAVVLQAIAGTDFTLSELTDEDGRLLRGSTISTQFNRFCKNTGVDATVPGSDAYLDNLLRLKILAEQNWSAGRFQASREGLHGEIQAFVETDVSRLIQVSAFGERFLTTCVKDVLATATGGGG